MNLHQNNSCQKQEKSQFTNLQLSQFLLSQNKNLQFKSDAEQNSDTDDDLIYNKQDKKELEEIILNQGDENKDVDQELNNKKKRKRRTKEEIQEHKMTELQMKLSKKEKKQQKILEKEQKKREEIQFRQEIEIFTNEQFFNKIIQKNQDFIVRRFPQLKQIYIGILFKVKFQNDRQFKSVLKIVKKNITNNYQVKYKFLIHALQERGLTQILDNNSKYKKYLNKEKIIEIIWVHDFTLFLLENISNKYQFKKEDKENTLQFRIKKNASKSYLIYPDNIPSCDFIRENSLRILNMIKITKKYDLNQQIYEIKAHRYCKRILKEIGFTLEWIEPIYTQNKSNLSQIQNSRKEKIIFKKGQKRIFFQDTNLHNNQQLQYWNITQIQELMNKLNKNNQKDEQEIEISNLKQTQKNLIPVFNDIVEEINKQLDGHQEQFISQFPQDQLQSDQILHNIQMSQLKNKLNDQNIKINFVQLKNQNEQNFFEQVDNQQKIKENIQEQFDYVKDQSNKQVIPACYNYKLYGKNTKRNQYNQYFETQEFNFVLHNLQNFLKENSKQALFLNVQYIENQIKKFSQ
ncbi:hypothetical protein PPERSA_05936 [Pseudocohnilembus persalinus]|uniref:Uncharacterized protein n=1 Tax=Pseudocohnilembus persalinus TaxID=266149 RepID=A0A0V0R456_PSEPJ|nr:hypothetical protein PPERSA_05936 [Pseudocohnilembus persalinus]|eukprot:KRX09267.1 hypothetical protein PPERSA_05936 [Pseudocohnilembus persalinus]